MRLPTRKAEKERLLNEQIDPHLTVSRISSLKQELDRLINDRPIAIEEVRRTAEMGDFSENAAYQDAKARLRRLNNRILQVEEMLKRAITIIADKKHDQVRLGSTVTVEHDGITQTFEIVGADEAEPSQGRISHKSPLGALLIGQKQDDKVVLNLNGKTLNYKITKIN